MELCGLILVRTSAHKLICDLYDIDADRIGFTINGRLWLYWVIPTTVYSYIGPFDEFNSRGCKIYYSALRDDVDIRLFEKILENYKPETTPPDAIDRQYKSGMAFGLRIVNSLLLKLGCTDLDDRKFDIPHKFFSNAAIYSENKDICPPICGDLVNLIMRDPPSLHNSLLDRIQKVVHQLLYCIDNSIPITIDNITELQKINIKLELNDYGEKYTGNLEKIKKDKLLVINIDGSLSSHIKSLRDEIDRIINGDRKINVLKILEYTNYLLTLLGQPRIKKRWNREPYSYYIGVADSVAEEGDGVTVSLSGDRELLIPLSGEGLDRLTIHQLKDIITVTSAIDMGDTRFEEIQKIATDLYYKASQ